MSPLTARYSPKTLVCAVSVVALMLCALLVSPARADAAPSNARLTATVVKTINHVRTSHHAPKLKVRAPLKRTAKAHVKKVAAKNRAKTRFHGEASVKARLKRAGYTAVTVREKVASVSLHGSAAHIRAKVAAKAKHLAMASKKLRSMGVAVRVDKKHHKVWITVDYASAKRVSVSPARAHAATPTKPSSPTKSKPLSPERAIANGVLAMLNSERAAHGRPALSMNAKLVNSAHAHNLAMARANTMSHQLPGEANLGDRVLRAGYDFHYAGENIGYNSDMTLAGAKLLEQLMYNEGPPPAGVVNHYANIVSSQFKNVGIDIYLDNVHHRLWLTEDFGTSF